MRLVPVTRTVTVTAEDIANGKRNDCDRCPVAVAAKRAFPELFAVEVFTENIRAFNPPADRPTLCANPTSQAHPYEVFQFIDAFDTKQEVQPFAFELTLSVNEAKLTTPLLPPTSQGEPAPL